MTQTLRRLLKRLPDFLKHPLCGFWFLVIQFWVCLSSSPSTKINGRAWANERSTKAVNLWGKKDTINILAKTKKGDRMAISNNSVNDFSRADWSKIIDESTDHEWKRWWRHGAQFLFLACAIYRETSIKKLLWKNKSVTISIVFTIIDHRKAIKMFKTLHWNHFSVMNILKSFLWSIRL